MLKRVFDFFFSAGTLVVLSPLLLFVAAWVPHDSPGPVLFRQWRVGRHGRAIDIFKFRTMQIDASRPLGGKLRYRSVVSCSDYDAVANRNRTYPTVGGADVPIDEDKIGRLLHLRP